MQAEMKVIYERVAIVFADGEEIYRGSEEVGRELLQVLGSVPTLESSPLVPTVLKDGARKLAICVQQQCARQGRVLLSTLRSLPVVLVPRFRRIRRASADTV